MIVGNKGGYADVYELVLLGTDKTGKDVWWTFYTSFATHNKFLPETQDVWRTFYTSFARNNKFLEVSTCTSADLAALAEGGAGPVYS